MKRLFLFFPTHLGILLLAGTLQSCAQTSSSPPVSRIQFTEKKIASEAYESAGVMDVNGDGVSDIVSGSFWYQGPEFRDRSFIKDQPRFGEYYDDFSTIPMDVNGDGRVDVVTGGWFGKNLVHSFDKIQAFLEQHVPGSVGNR